MCLPSIAEGEQASGTDVDHSLAVAPGHRRLTAILRQRRGIATRVRTVALPEAPDHASAPRSLSEKSSAACLAFPERVFGLPILLPIRD
jgi:hypothetical protein